MKFVKCIHFIHSFNKRNDFCASAIILLFFPFLLMALAMLIRAFYAIIIKMRTQQKKNKNKMEKYWKVVVDCIRHKEEHLILWKCTWKQQFNMIMAIAIIFTIVITFSFSIENPKNHNALHAHSIQNVHLNAQRLGQF